MKQPPQRLAERRSATRQTGTFTFWFRRPNAGKHVGAWMLNQNQEEAAFLTTVGDAPRMGEQLELTDSHQAVPATAENLRGSACHLPQFGRVVRLDDPQGVTRRVAIRFESRPPSSPV